MKKIIRFTETNEAYVFTNDEVCLLEINKKDMKLDVRQFYMSFFSQEREYENIQFENMLSEDKDATRVYDSVKSLFTEIVEKLRAQ